MPIILSNNGLKLPRILCVILMLFMLDGCSNDPRGTSGADYIPVEQIIELRKMFYARNYLGLERFVEDLQNNSEKDPAAENFMYDVETVFSYGFRDDEVIYSEWLEQRPDSWVAHLARGLYYKKLGWNARGSGYTDTVTDGHFARMEVYFEKARDALRDALKAKPKLTLAYGALINMAMASSLNAEKQQLLKEALTQVPTSYLVRDMYLTSLLPKWGGSWEEVDSFTERTYAIRDKNPLFSRLRGIGHFYLAQDYSRIKQYEKAITEVNKAIEIDPFWRFYNERAYNYMRLGEYDLALEDINVADINRKDVEQVLSRRADILMEIKQYDRALLDIERAAVLYPGSSYVLSRRANLYWNMNEYEKAKDAYTAILELDPENAWAMATRGTLNLKKLHDYKAAAEDLLSAYSKKPRPDTWYDYATALYYLKDEKTLAAYERFLSICSQEECHSKDKAWAENFVKCVNGDESCTWRPEFYASFKKAG